MRETETPKAAREPNPREPRSLPYPAAPLAHYNGGVKAVISALVLLAALAALGCVTGGGRGAPELERRAHDLNKTIMCPLCPGESIDQSQNPLSVQMRAAVAEKIEAGWSDNQIREFFVERYGPSVLMEPPSEGFGLAAWIVPPVAFALALAGLLAALRWMSSRAPDDDAGGGAASQARRLARLRDALGDSETDADSERPNADGRRAAGAKSDAREDAG